MKKTQCGFWSAEMITQEHIVIMDAHELPLSPSKGCRADLTMGSTEPGAEFIIVLTLYCKKEDKKKDG
jgi:hypothetical protein